MILAKLKSYARDERAVAAVEFALVLPLLLALYLGSVEASRLYTADRKVATLASAVADLVSRRKDEIDLSTVNDYFAAATTMMQPLSTTGLGQTVSLLQINNAGEATVRWSVATGTGAVREVNSPFPLAATTRINQLARNASGWLVAAEVEYPYVPMVNYIITDTVTLKHVEYFLPRFADEIVLDNNG